MKAHQQTVELLHRNLARQSVRKEQRRLWPAELQRKFAQASLQRSAERNDQGGVTARAVPEGGPAMPTDLQPPLLVPDLPGRGGCGTRRVNGLVG